MTPLQNDFQFYFNECWPVEYKRRLTQPSSYLKYWAGSNFTMKITCFFLSSNLGLSSFKNFIFIFQLVSSTTPAFVDDDPVCLLSVCLSVSLFICLFNCIYICLFNWIFGCLFGFVSVSVFLFFLFSICFFGFVAVCVSLCPSLCRFVF